MFFRLYNRRQRADLIKSSALRLRVSTLTLSKERIQLKISHLQKQLKLFERAKNMCEMNLKSSDFKISLYFCTVSNVVR